MPPFPHLTRRAFARFALIGMAAASMLGATAATSFASAESAEGARATAMEAAEATQQPSQRKLRIGISIPAADHGWTAGVKWWAERAIAMHPDVDWTLTTSAEPSAQIAAVEDMMARGIDALVILATESAPLTPIAKEAHERGIFIVNVDRGFLEPVADLFIEGDNKAFGRKSAQFMVEKLGGKGNIVILEGIPSTVNSDRVNAAKEVFSQHPGIKVLASQPAMWNREKGLQVMENYLQQFPKIDAVWAQDDDILMGAMQAVKEAGREDEMWMLGGAGMKEVVRMVMDGDSLIPADITYPPSMIATGIHLCHSVLRDGRKEEVMQFMPKHLLLDVELITPENAKQYHFPDSVY